ncbi:RcnB family protein [Sphingobium phenoxybenzoativorans]|nr:RcnB family protein [Sphingobium phenoxybenzoativorans]
MMRKMMLAGLMAATILSAATPAMAQDAGRRDWGGTRSNNLETRGGDRTPRGDRGGQWQGRQQRPQAAPQAQPQASAQAQGKMQERRRYMEQRPSGDNGQWRQNNQWQQAQAAQAAQQARQTQQRVESSSTLGRDSRAWRDERRNARQDGRTIPGSTEGWRNRTGDDRRDRDANWRNNDDRRDSNWRNDNRRDNDWRNNGQRYGNNRNWAYNGGRLNDRQRWQDQRRWDSGWRNDRRYDWRSYRNSYRSIYSPGRYYAPRGWSYGYRPFSSGIFIDSMFYSNNYWLDDPYEYRLPPAYGSMRWIRYYDDALLVDMRDGYVVDVIRNFFW